MYTQLRTCSVHWPRRGPRSYFDRGSKKLDPWCGEISCDIRHARFKHGEVQLPSSRSRARTPTAASELRPRMAGLV